MVTIRDTLESAASLSGDRLADRSTEAGTKQRVQSFDVDHTSASGVHAETTLSADPLRVILQERGDRYGDFNDNAAIAQHLKQVLYTAVGYENLRPVHREALDMICAKMSRIVTASPEYRDNWDDIAGFATITANRCVGEKDYKP